MPYEEVKPLVIRANVGDKIEICFFHYLNRALSMHVQGLPYDVQTSDGADVGYNRNTTTKNNIVYTWYADREGVYLFHDMADTRSSEEGTNVHGLFGAVIVEAAESVWLDPQTGEELDAWLGLWGIIRAYAKPQKCLKPLCKQDNRILPLPPCPGAGAVIRRYEIAAIQRDIPYNCHGDHDPDGLLFVPLEEAERAREKDYQPRPLILRANAGDWIEVTLHNLFDAKHPVRYFDYPRVPLDMEHKPSMRVSLNPQFLDFDPVCDSGINVGYNNREQTVGVGESKKYLWYAREEYGACILQSFGDMRNHRYHGLFGAVLIEPAGAEWYRAESLAQAVYDEEAVITAPGVEPFRECAVFIQNGIRMLDASGELVKTASGEEEDDVDAEDTGEKGYNYRSERFANRLKKDRRISKIFSSRVHGDPATPLFSAYPGERVIFRTVMPADKPRNVGICIHDNRWKLQPQRPDARVTSLQGAVSVGNTFQLELELGAPCPGDYLYRSGSLKWDVESGMWGIFRVRRQGFGCKCKNMCRKIWKGICSKR